MCSTHTNQKIRREKPKVRTLSEKAKKRVPPIRRALKAQKRSLSLLFSVSLFLVLLPVCFFFFFFFLLRVSKSTKDKKTPFFFCHVAHPKKRERFFKRHLFLQKKKCTSCFANCYRRPLRDAGCSRLLRLRRRRRRRARTRRVPTRRKAIKRRQSNRARRS